MPCKRGRSGVPSPILALQTRTGYLPAAGYFESPDGRRAVDRAVRGAGPNPENVLAEAEARRSER